MIDFGQAEKRIQHLFEQAHQVQFEGKMWQVVKVAKPTCDKGEPKTDIYVLLQHNDVTQEIKISYKKTNADFLENKMSAERAKLIFGQDWQNIIQHSTAQIKDQFLKKILVYKEKFGRTEKGSITLGWKFELVNKSGGELSGKLILTQNQLIDIYAGHNLPMDKQHAKVNGEIIPYSGVANYILVGQDFQSAEDVLVKMQSIDDYVAKNSDIYFACKALNYRTFPNKYDGDRPLAVQVDWEIINAKLTPNLTFNHPLHRKGNELANKLIACLSQLNVQTTDDLNTENLNTTQIYELKI